MYRGASVNMLELDLSITWKRFAIFCGRDSALVDSQSSFFFSDRFPKQVAGLFVLIQHRIYHIPIAMQIVQAKKASASASDGIQ